MHEWLMDLLADRKGEGAFTCFGPFHLTMVGLFLSVMGLLWLWLRGKDFSRRKKAIDFWGDLAFGLYVLDFFLMPLAYGHIEIEKLPFHVCTAMCVLCFLSRRCQRLGSLRIHFAVYALISNLVYLCYPAGVMWQGVQPLTYRVLQTLVFHGVMTVYGFLVICFEPLPQRRNWAAELGVIAAMAAWAMVGNWLYNGAYGTQTYFFNWFFVVRDPFWLLPEGIAPFIMPGLNVGLFFAVGSLIWWGMMRLRNATEKN
jgi:uncharacterized membrane protein